MSILTRPDGLKYDPESGVILAPRSRIIPDPNQPRKHFPQSELNELRRAIDTVRDAGGGLSKTGFDMPFLCRWEPGTLGKDGNPTKSSLLIIEDGERRWRSTDESYSIIPLVIKNDSSEEAWDVALRSSFQKKLLTPVEEGDALAAFMERSGFGTYRTSKHFGLSEGYVKNRIYLRQCPKDVQRMVNAHSDTMSHALAFRAAGDKLPADDRKQLIDEVLSGMSLVDLKEEIAARIQANNIRKDAKSQPDTHTKKRRAIASTARGVSTSHGETTSSASIDEAKTEISELITEITGKIVALESYSQSVDREYFNKIVLPHIQRWQSTLDRLLQ